VKNLKNNHYFKHKNLKENSKKVEKHTWVGEKSQKGQVHVRSTHRKSKEKRINRQKKIKKSEMRKSAAPGNAI
jgi:hypothetical protein